MREQKELPSFPKECGHQNTQPNMTKEPSLPYSIPGNRLLGFSCWYWNLRAWMASSQRSVLAGGLWMGFLCLGEIFKRVTCFQKYEVSLFHVFFCHYFSHFLETINQWCLGCVVCAVFAAQLGDGEPAPMLVLFTFFLVRPLNGHIKLKKC
jgi:hypothetical protein